MHFVCVWMRSPTEPEHYMVLLADIMLMDLPLEALSTLQDDSLCSVSRDFSLQLLHSRLRDQPHKGTGYINTVLCTSVRFFSSFGKYRNDTFGLKLLCRKIIHLSSTVFSFNGVMRLPHQLIPGLKYRD